MFKVGDKVFSVPSLMDGRIEIDKVHLHYLFKDGSEHYEITTRGYYQESDLILVTEEDIREIGELKQKILTRKRG